MTIAELDDTFYQDADTFFQNQAGTALTYADLSLKTGHSTILPVQADPTTQLTERIRLSTPIVSADMDTVTEWEMAAQMALNGGLGIIHSNLKPEDQIRQISRVKHHVHGIIDHPIHVSPANSIGDILELVARKGYSFRTFPVCDQSGKLLGLLPGKAVVERHRSKNVGDVMMPLKDVRKIKESELGDNPIETAHAFFSQSYNINKLLIVDDAGNLKGLIIASDIDRIMQEQNSAIIPSRDTNHRLQVGATLYMFRDQDGELDRDKIIQHTGELVDAGVDLAAVSVAHGHTQSVGEMIAMVREEFGELEILAGNVTSAAGVKFLAEQGANVIKVGQGPGSICTTRIKAGVGIPQMTALYVCSKAAQLLDGKVKIIADGGIVHSGDVVKALTLADAVMMGSILAGSQESPGELFEIDGKKFKAYRGMGSVEAMKAGSAARYGQAGVKDDTVRKFSSEGIAGMKPCIGPVADVLHEYRGSLQSGMAYTGSGDLATLKQNARYTRVTPAGDRESNPHDVVEVKIAST